MKLPHPIYNGGHIDSMDSLAAILTVSESELLHTNAIADKFYHPNKPILKSDGKRYRRTYRVSGALKVLQSKIKAEILDQVAFPNYLQGSIRDLNNRRGYIRNAELHVNQHFWIHEDISNFFSSVKFHHVRNVWFDFFGFPEHVARVLANLTTNRNFLPEGASTSSGISNLIFWDVEPTVETEFRNKGYIYTRYVDDIMVSSQHRMDKSEQSWITSIVYGMLASKGLKPNRVKRCSWSKAQKPTIHGLRVDGKNPTIPKKKRGRVRVAVKECELSAKVSRSTPEYKKLFYKTFGRVTELERLHPKEGKKLREVLEAIKPL